MLRTVSPDQSPSIASDQTPAPNPDGDLIAKARKLRKAKIREEDLMILVDRLMKEAEASVEVSAALHMRDGDDDIFARLGISPPRARDDGRRIIGHPMFVEIEQGYLDLPSATDRRRCSDILRAGKDRDAAIYSYDDVNDWLKTDAKCERAGARVAAQMPKLAQMQAHTFDGIRAKLSIVESFDGSVADMLRESGGINGIVWSIMRDLLAMHRTSTADERSTRFAVS